MKMSPKERLETVIAGGIPDRVPATVHQWQPYHYRNIMGVADELEAFLAIGLDAVIYPWACVTSRECPDWVTTRTENPANGGLVEIEYQIATPGGVLSGREMRSDYTTSTVEHAFKEPGHIRLIEKYHPVPDLDLEAVRALKSRLGKTVRSAPSVAGRPTEGSFPGARLCGDAVFSKSWPRVESQFIRGRCGKIREAIMKPQHKDRRRQRSGRNARVATLKPPQRIPADKKPCRHIRSGNSALASGKGDVAPELAKRMPGGNRKRSFVWHGVTVRYGRRMVNKRPL